MNESDTPTTSSPPALLLQKIYLKDASFETPGGLHVFQQAWKPHFTQQLQTRHTPVQADLYEVVLVATLTAQIGENDRMQTAFIVEVQQAGLFRINASSTEQMEKLVNVGCPTVLFPYIREAIDSLVVKGGFPAAHLRPVNFETLYQQARQQAQKESAH